MALSDLRTNGRSALGWVRAHPTATGLLALGGLGLPAFLVLIYLHLVVAIALLALIGAGALAILLLARRRRSAAEPWQPAGRVVLGSAALSVVLVFGLIQLVPYGRDHSNPPITGEPRWADARTRELMVDACYACHSNEVEYPGYASIAPLSWAVQRHVDEGRAEVNYSEFASDPSDADETLEVVEEGEMPPASYTRFGRHPEANLSDRELRELIDGLRATPGLVERDDD